MSPRPRHHLALGVRQNSSNALETIESFHLHNGTGTYIEQHRKPSEFPNHQSNPIQSFLV